MAGLFKKIIKGVLIGGGSLLSLFAPAIGAPLIVAGLEIKTKDAGTADVVSAYGGKLAETLNKVSAIQSATKQPGLTIGTSNVIEFIKQNILLIVGGVAALFLLPKLFNTRRR